MSLLLSSSMVYADWTVNMRQGVTAISREIYELHMLIFWVCVVIGVLVVNSLVALGRIGAARRRQPVPPSVVADESPHD